MPRWVWIIMTSSLWACGTDPVTATDGGASSPGFDGGTCTASVAQRRMPAASHVAQGAPLTFSSNPPAGGDHYGAWLRWANVYERVERGNYLHNMEHGGVVLMNACKTGCEAVSEELGRIGRALPKDPKCLDDINARWLVTRDTELPDGLQVAVAAWGWTFTATCVDTAKIRAFIDEHYAKAPEDFCFEGTLP